MQIRNVCVLGGTGFVGRHVVRRLAERGIQVRVPTRRRERSKELLVLPTADVVEGHVHDPAQLAEMLRGMDAVINLVGILHESRSASFQEVHAELPKKVAEACVAQGIRRLVHMSALRAAPDAPSAYLRSKGRGEAAVKQADGLSTVFRPSVIFGPGDRFLNTFSALQRRLPVMLLACPQARFQPVFVEDVARSMVDCLENPATFGQAYELCGPRVYTLRELVAFAGRMGGHPRPIIGLNDRLSRLQARCLEWLPIKLLTRDNLLSMQVDSVCSCAFPFPFAPTPLEAAAGYLRNAGPPTGYSRYRPRAGR